MVWKGTEGTIKKYRNLFCFHVNYQTDFLVEMVVTGRSNRTFGWLLEKMKEKEDSNLYQTGGRKANSGWSLIGDTWILDGGMEFSEDLQTRVLSKKQEWWEYFNWGAEDSVRWLHWRVQCALSGVQKTVGDGYIEESVVLSHNLDWRWEYKNVI